MVLDESKIVCSEQLFIVGKCTGLLYNEVKKTTVFIIVETNLYNSRKFCKTFNKLLKNQLYFTYRICFASLSYVPRSIILETLKNVWLKIKWFFKFIKVRGTSCWITLSLEVEVKPQSPIEVQNQNNNPVSYTHLDVYKRQECTV